ncbi:hypothetical protein MUU49_01495 [Scandinavium goeteborgense]|uniref:hypothetical protein n=1 Tax=Scandinavium goeteborgense TaxID=1851514 RepID=UPI00216511D0|nr:hypothetical protein [Scandinavium goeteborgense]MCS2151262.1 hypothetical protein [Scandinavium goeteborgense]
MNFTFYHITGKVCVALLALYSCQSFAEKISADQLQQMLKEQDPFSVVKTLHHSNQGQDWREVINQIKTGDPDWLKVAISLEKGVRTKGAETLMDAVARAIPENPSGVLHILSDKNIFLNEPNVCSLPLIPTDNKTDVTFKQNALGAVQAQPEGKRCSRIMQSAISDSHSPLGE